MATAKTTHHLNVSGVHALLNSPNGGVAKDLLRRGLRVASAAKKNLETEPRRVNTGALRADIHPELVIINGKIALRVGTNKSYALWVHDGTGIYGPRGERITPHSAKALRWKSKKYGAKKGKFKGFAFAKSIAGMKPNKFLKNALHAARG